MALTFTLPELGENIEFGSVTKVLVSVGDTVAKDQTVLELETDKAVVEVPSPASGTVSEVHVKEGDTLNVGDVIVVIAEAEGAKAQKKKPESAPTAPLKKETKRERPPVAEQAPPKSEPPPVESEKKAAPAKGDGHEVPSRSRSVASPSVRRLAREVGVDIARITSSEPGGRVSIEDVKAHARRANVDTAGFVRTGAQRAVVPLPDFERWGEVERQKLSNVRSRTAERMTLSWTTIPHVTQHDKADITELERMRKRYAPRAEAAGGKLTATAIIVKIVASALRKFPQFNSSIDLEHQELIVKNYRNIGIAVDTNRGLIVPVVKSADDKNIIEISVELTRLGERARNAKTSLDEMQGGTFTITNLGGIGGTAFTPIVNAPEVAILGVSRAEVEAVYKDGQFVPRTLMPLALSYDHRVIDEADAARFLRWVCEALEQPFLIFLEG